MTISHSRRAILTFALATWLLAWVTPHAIAIPRTWIGGNADWHSNSSHWSPAGNPNSSDEVNFNTANTVSLGIKQTVGDLALSGGIDLFTNGFLLIVADATTVSVNDTVLHIDGPLSTLDGRTVALYDGASIQLDGGKLRTVSSSTLSGILDINSATTIEGHGLIQFDDTVSSPTSLLINDGVLSAVSSPLVPGSEPPPATLTINVTNSNMRIDLDGSGENGVVHVGQNQTLDINGILADFFSGAVSLMHQSVLDLSSGMTFHGSMVIDTSVVDNPHPQPDIPAGTATIAGGMFSQGGGTINVPDADDTLIFAASFAAFGGSFTNRGHVRFDGGGSIAGPSNFIMQGDYASLTIGPSRTFNISKADFDIDGNGTPTNVVTVNSNSSLGLHIGPTGDDTISGTVNLKGGELVMTTADNTWHLQGNVNVSSDLVPARLTGEELIVDDATIHIEENAQLLVNTASQWHAGTSVTVSTGSMLSLNSNTTLLIGPTFSGGGTLRLNSNSTLMGATVDTGTFDWDGASNLGIHTIPAGSSFTINSPVFDTDGDMDDTFHLGAGATLTVNGSAQWILEGTMNAGAPAPALAAIVAGASDFIHQGIINVDGDTEITTDVTFGATSITSIDANTTLKLSGGSKHIEAAASLQGAGTLLNPAGGSALVIQNNAVVNVQVRNEAGLAIGNNTPAHATGSNLEQTSTGTWIVDVHGTSAGAFDSLNLTSSMQAAGALAIHLGGSYTPALGDEVEILNVAAGITGVFSISQPTGMPAGQFFHARYDESEVRLIVRDTLPGDFNRDGVVDAGDYILWRKTFGQATASFDAADGNGNGIVDSNDYSVWRAHFGQSGAAGSGGSSTIPEPPLSVLLLSAALTRARRRQHGSYC